MRVVFWYPNNNVLFLNNLRNSNGFYYLINMMRRLRKITSKSKDSKLDEKGVKEFYKMLLKFEKRHPTFNAKKVFIRLYPNSIIS